MDPKRLQRLVDSIATKQLPDGTWELKHDNATEFYNYIKGYVWHSAKKSDRYDADDAAQDIIENVWKALKRYGPRYRNKPFYELFRTKVNNVLTNRYNKRISDKNVLNYPEQKVNNKKKKKKYFPNVVSLDNITSEDLEGNVIGIRNMPTTNPIDLCEIKEQLAKVDCKKLEKLCRLSCDEENKMPQKLTADEIVNYIRRLPNEEKGALCIELLAMVSKISSRSFKKIMAPFADLILSPNNPAKKSIQSEYNDQGKDNKTKYRVAFTDVTKRDEKKEKAMAKKAKNEGYIEIGEGDVGQQFMTPFDKKIQIVSKTAKKVKILILASEEELEVPLNYMVLPVSVSSEDAETDPVEASLNNSKEDDNDEDDNDEDDNDEDDNDEDDNDEDDNDNDEDEDEDEDEGEGEDDDDSDEDDGNEEEEESEEEEDDDEDSSDEDEDDEDVEMPTPKTSDEDDMDVLEDEDDSEDEEAEDSLDEDEDDNEPEEEEKPMKKSRKKRKNKRAAKETKKRRGRPPKKNKKGKRGRKAAKKAEDKVQRRTRKGTAKELVIKLLKKKEQTRDSLAEAIIDNKLTTNKSPEKVKNYVSVMLSNLKREGIKLETGKRGVYRIKK